MIIVFDDPTTYEVADIDHAMELSRYFEEVRFMDLTNKIEYVLFDGKYRMVENARN